MHIVFFFIIPLALSSTDYEPVLSDSGKKKLMENIATLDKNLGITKNNIVNCRKNAGVIESELHDLSVLEKEHLQIKSKYMQQVETTESEIEKNEAAIRELESFQKNIAKNATPSSDNKPLQQDDLLRSQKDRQERDKWKSEASEKIEKIRNQLGSINQNLGTITEKKNQLREQLKLWVTKEKEYQKTLAELNSKKSETAKALKPPN